MENLEHNIQKIWCKNKMTGLTWCEVNKLQNSKSLSVCPPPNLLYTVWQLTACDLRKRFYVWEKKNNRKITILLPNDHSTITQLNAKCSLHYNQPIYNLHTCGIDYNHKYLWIVLLICVRFHMEIVIKKFVFSSHKAHFCDFWMTGGSHQPQDRTSVCRWKLPQ